MAEERIVIEIEADGTIKAKTDGFKGDICLEKLQELLGNEPFSTVKPSDDFYQEVEVKVEGKITTRGKQ